MDTFTEERIPVIAEMLSKTTGLYIQTVSESQTDVDVDEHHKSRREGAWTRGGALFMLGINYRWSSIVLEERDAYYADKDKKPGLLAQMKKDAYGGYEKGLCAGDRTPDAPGLLVSGAGEPTTIYKLLKPSAHTVLAFGPATAVADAIGGLSSSTKGITQTFHVSRTITAVADGVTALVDSEGHAHDGYLVKDDGGLTIVVIRPDGYIGAITRDKAGLQKYFDNILIH